MCVIPFWHRQAGDSAHPNPCPAPASSALAPASSTATLPRQLLPTGMITILVFTSLPHILQVRVIFFTAFQIAVVLRRGVLVTLRERALTLYSWAICKIIFDEIGFYVENFRESENLKEQENREVKMTSYRTAAWCFLQLYCWPLRPRVKNKCEVITRNVKGKKKYCMKE